jgi:hypothetical protein
MTQGQEKKGIRNDDKYFPIAPKPLPVPPPTPDKPPKQTQQTGKNSN